MPKEFFADGNTVVTLGEYSATFNATGKSFKAPFAHVWRLADGKVTEFPQERGQVHFFPETKCA